ncbi:MAG: putative glycosyl hydrolase [Pseudonocardiales bacterium]|nr:putative glycosyl hydrolase [Pseudonocardiales bacterium]
MTRIELWAPIPDRVQLWIDHEGTEAVHEMTRESDGWWTIDAPDAVTGADYGFRLDDDDAVLTDPRSRWQPSGVHGPSRIYDSGAFTWTDSSWPGKNLPDSVIYELHVGTFTGAGTFDAAIDRLDYLAELGVTHVELLPVNDFNGEWNWGYDGVLWYAVHETYGGPDGLKRFVDASHARGLAVVLDVVYNHLGPSGNYLPRFGPYFKTGRSTWGDLVNLDGEGAAPIREYIIGNALMWLDEFHIDALRLDAVHALHDSSTPHLLAELSERVEALSARLERPLTLIAESDLNDPSMVTSRAEGGYGMDAQWDDDVHHALHTALSGERQGYYSDFGSMSVLAKVMTRAFFHDGTYSSFRERRHGRPVDRAHTPGYRFVVCLQNHDQVGNRAVGDRLPEIASTEVLEVGAVLLLTSPFTPMLWMGEEWAASTRWPFFTSHPEPELAEATGQGRIEEFGQHGWDVSQMIDPQDPLAFESAHLNWDEPETAGHAEILEVYRTLLALRHENADLRDPRLDQVDTEHDDDAAWIAIRRGQFTVLANLGDTQHVFDVGQHEVVYATPAAQPTMGRDRSTGVALPARSAMIIRTGEF